MIVIRLISKDAFSSKRSRDASEVIPYMENHLGVNHVSRKAPRAARSSGMEKNRTSPRAFEPSLHLSHDLHRKQVLENENFYDQNYESL